jgi:hypothetical protein
LTLLVDTFDTPPPFLPNRKPKKQKIEEAVTELLKANGGAWTGTATALLTALVTQTSVSSPEAIGRALKQMESIAITYPQRKNDERLIHLKLANPRQNLSPDSPIPTPEPTPDANPTPTVPIADRESAFHCEARDGV